MLGAEVGDVGSEQQQALQHRQAQRVQQPEILASGFAVWGLWHSHFVGAEPDGHVAVYQGLPWNIAGNLHLYRAVYVSPLQAVQLSEPERKKLFDHSLRSKSSAFAAVRRYENQIGNSP